MIFSQKLKELDSVLDPEFEQLFDCVKAKQSHPNDLLIWLNNGFYDESMLNFKPSDGKKINPHVVGPGQIGFSEDTHYKFIHQYRQAYLSKVSFDEYRKMLEYSPERSEEIDHTIEIESTTINLEMLVYLKIWEADNFIKKFYELARLLNSEPYDWYFQIKESNRDASNSETRQEIIRKRIRERFKGFKGIHNAFKTAYKTQIRNAIAHSKFSFHSRNIHLHNYIATDKASQLKTISFDEWIEIFHATLSLHNQYIGFHNKVQELYEDLSQKNGNELLIKITESDGKAYELPMIYRPEWKDWHYKQT